MGKNKIDIKFIENGYQRRRTFIRRKPCVFKKASELSKLCGGRSCVIIDSPYEPHHEVQPPKEEAIEMVRKAEEMLCQQAIETQEGITKLKQRNHECEMAILMREYMTCQRSTSEIGSEEARGLFRMAEEQLRAVQARIGVHHKCEMAILMREYMTCQRSTSEIGSEEARGLFRMAEERLRAVQARIGVHHECEMAILMREYMTCQRSTSEIGSEEARGLFRMAEERLRAVQARIGVLSSTTAPIPAQEIPRIRQSQEDVQEASQEQQGLFLHQFL